MNHPVVNQPGYSDKLRDCRELIRGRTDVLAIWTEVTKRPQGQRTNLVDNINEVPERPTGTSKEAGLRTLQKHASEGNEKAADELAKVIAGEKKVHTACVDAGLRKSTRIDTDVKQRCDQANAERVEHLPHEVLEAFVSDCFAAGHKSLGIAIKNLIGSIHHGSEVWPMTRISADHYRDLVTITTISISGRFLDRFNDIFTDSGDQKR